MSVIAKRDPWINTWNYWVFFVSFPFFLNYINSPQSYTTLILTCQLAVRQVTYSTWIPETLFNWIHKTFSWPKGPENSRCSVHIFCLMWLLHKKSEKKKNSVGVAFPTGIKSWWSITRQHSSLSKRNYTGIDC